MKFEIYKSKDKGDQCYRWRLVASNGKILAVGAESFHKKTIRKSIENLQASADEAKIVWKK